MLDALKMEKLGVPSAVICTEPFLRSARMMALAHGAPEYPIQLIAHPIAATKPEELFPRVEEIIPSILQCYLK